MPYIRTAILTLICGAGFLAACSPEKPWMMEQSSVTPNKIQLVESRHIVKKPLSELSSDDIANAAHVYGRNGAGPMYVVIAYNYQGKTGGHNFDAKSQALAADLQAKGIASRDIVASTVPLDTPTPVALIAFDTLEAQGPKDCTAMPGLETLPGESSGFDYDLGCGVKATMARQIADPRDLQGREGLGGRNDGARAANIVNGYRLDETPRDFLPSYVIAELAGSGGS